MKDIIILSVASEDVVAGGKGEGGGGGGDEVWGIGGGDERSSKGWEGEGAAEPTEVKLSFDDERIGSAGGRNRLYFVWRSGSVQRRRRTFGCTYNAT